MSKKYESAFGKVENKYYKTDIYNVVENVMMVSFILLFPFVIAGIIGGIYYKKTLVVVFAVLVAFIMLVCFASSFIMSYLTRKRGDLVQAIIIKVSGHLITYEYTNRNRKIIRSGGKLLKRGKVGLTVGSLITIKVYKGKSCIISEF